ncbi:MAG: hypothetical protein OXU36_06470 [Candidatus Poribacteria bacterium]|nr:hypothetical protein [Candidatus Poribacteria bacterium]
MKKQKILIYDDEHGRIDDFKGKLGEGLDQAGQSEDFDIIALENDAFQDSIRVLEQRRIAFRNEEESTKNGAEEIDNASIFIIDYDLLGNQVEESAVGSLTGEIIAYLVRCFSKCKLIVGLNQYGSNPFDLTLRGDLDSFADLNLGEYQLNNPDLWRGDWGDSRQGFRPWHWPNLRDALHNFDERVKDVEKNIDTSICEFLGFGSELFQLLPREIVQFIEKQDQKEHFQTTFREFVTESGNALRFKDTKTLDKGMNDHILARVGAARISKWLECLLLPEQDILVDAPHLISRYPSLMTGEKKKIETWNKGAQLICRDKLGLRTDLIEPYRFKKDHWVSRPVWFWDRLRECEHIREIIEPWLTVKPDWVFCEDASYFYNRENCREFLADTASPFTQRFVKYFDEVDYRPRVRFSL